MNYVLPIFINMQVPATKLLENIIRQELSLLRENHHEFFANDYSDESDIAKTSSTTKPYTGDLKKYIGKKLPKSTAGDLQKFFGLSVDGQFGDDTSKAVADFIYGPNTGHGIKTVSDLYDRMKEDGWDVGTKTGTIFANNGKMANSIIELMQQRTKYAPMGSYFGLDIKYLTHPAYSAYPDIDQVKFGLDYGGRNKYSTTRGRDFVKKFKELGKNPNQPKNLPDEFVNGFDRKQAADISWYWYTKLQQAIKPTESGFLGLKSYGSDITGPTAGENVCVSLLKMLEFLKTIGIVEMFALIETSDDPDSIFQTIIDYALKYYPTTNGKQNFSSKCMLYPAERKKLQDAFIYAEEHIRQQIDLTGAEYPELEAYGDVWVKQKKHISRSLYKLGAVLNIEGFQQPARYLAIKRSPYEDIGKYSGLSGPGDMVGTGASSPGMSSSFGKVYSTSADNVIGKKIYDNPHEALLALHIATGFLGGVGLLISAGIMVGDAALYYEEGNYQMAGLSVIFAVLPLIKIPGLKEWGKAQWAAFSERVLGKSYQAIAASDRIVLQQILKAKDKIVAVIDRYVSQAAKGAAARYTLAEVRKDPIKFLMRKLANGTLNAARFTAFVTKEAAPYITASKAWDYIYQSLGISKKAMADMTDYDLNKLLAEQEKNLNTGETGEYDDLEEMILKQLNI